MKHVIISIGHDANSQGASYGNITEYSYNSNLVEYMKEAVYSHPEKSVIFHFVDTTLRHTVIKINELVAEYGKDNCIAIELHLNSSRSIAHGCETLYFPFSKTSKKLATRFNDDLYERAWHFVGPNRGAKPGWYQGIKNGTLLYFLHRTACPALIIEPMFIWQALELTNLESDLLAAHITNTAINLFK